MRDLQTCIHRVQADLPITEEEYLMVKAHVEERLRTMHHFPLLVLGVALVAAAGVFIYGIFFYDG